MLTNNILQMTINVNQKAPNFILLDQNSSEIELKTLKNKLILFFYPKDNTPWCTKEAISFSKYKNKINNLGYHIYGISKDSVKKHQNFVDKQKLTVDLLSDENQNTCEKYGVWVEKSMYGRKYFGIEKDKKYFKAASERINKTQIIEDNYLDTIENNKSKPRIPFGSLVEMGIIKPGAILFDQKKKFNAKIMVDGSLKHKDSEGSIHKVAAKIMGTESYNGWTYWYCNIRGTIVPIDNLRQRLISNST